MKQYVIIDIEQNTVQPDGKVLIVKANEAKRSAGFEHLEKMFGNVQKSPTKMNLSVLL